MTDVRWRLAIDVGGTFADAVAVAPDGRRRRTKVLSASAVRVTVDPIDDRHARLGSRAAPPSAGFVGMSIGRPGLRDRRDVVTVAAFDVATGVATFDRPWSDPPRVADLFADEVAPTLAARLLTETPVGGTVPPSSLRLATTRGTNALLERGGAPTVWCVTEGFADLLSIGDQSRPDLFARVVRKPAPLADRVLEIPGRLAADGTEIVPFDADVFETRARTAVAEGFRHAAVTLLHGWKRPDLEARVADVLRGVGIASVVTGSDAAPHPGLLARAETTVLDARLGPALTDYCRQVSRSLPGTDILYMTSSGMLVPLEAFPPSAALLSGPAGGAAGAARAAARARCGRVLAFDMGGTSTDVARIDGAVDVDPVHAVGGVRIAAPAVAVESVAAGGGSICDVERGIPRVGPRSAGAHPGPACYGAGGPLTITDCNLLLGRIPESRFGIAVDARPAEERLGELLPKVAGGLDAHELLEGFLAIADERMAEAVREVSVRRGFDPKDHALLAFGGAGGLHACAVASRLGMNRVVVPRDQGLLSAVGALEHGRGALKRVSFEASLAGSTEALGDRIDRVVAELVASIEGDPATTSVEVVLEVRLRGQDSALDVPWTRGADLASAFAEAHRRTYGFLPSARAAEIIAFRVRTTTAPTDIPDAMVVRPASAATADRRRVRFDGRWFETPVFERDALAPGTCVSGPCLVVEPHGTTLIAPAWDLTVDASGALVLDHVRPDVGPRPAVAVAWELFSHRFRSIALEMGEVLRRAAVSTNIKERLDFSCAVLDARGRLVVNAPHIPVHLGAMGLCAQALLATAAPRPGDAFVVNHPAFGGSHLPDVTVMTPVFDGSERLVAWIGSRAHHAELGGIVPGSMPPAARSLAEEGVALSPIRIAERGATSFDAVAAALRNAPFPSRSPDDNLADLGAQLAANRRGSDRILALIDRHGREAVLDAMDALRSHARTVVEEALARLGPAPRRAEGTLDDGTRIAVSVDAANGRPRVSFAGTSATHPGSLNATPAVTRACVLYALRLLVDEPLPLNEGFLEAVDLDVPPGLLNPTFDPDPARCPAVVAGNVETSQRVVDVLVSALGIGAQSQGTMNNVTFGHAGGSHYETIGGGSGATPDADGASGVQVHMTNTRITDPETLEMRHAVRLRRFALRGGSGGRGRHRGGDGLVRVYEFLAPVTVSILSQRRTAGPEGVDGGEAGLAGRQWVRRADGRVELLPGMVTFEAGTGDVLTVETPGGGGFGAVD